MFEFLKKFRKGNAEEEPKQPEELQQEQSQPEELRQEQQQPEELQQETQLAESPEETQQVEVEPELQQVEAEPIFQPEDITASEQDFATEEGSFTAPEPETPKKKGFFSRLVEGLTKTRAQIVTGFDSLFSRFQTIDDDFYEELEEIMIMGDLGVRTTDEIIEDLKESVKKEHIHKPEECRQFLIDSIKARMQPGEDAYRFEKEKSILMVIGVNGVGKTTSIGKLSAKMKAQGRKVVVAAADTFRAGAIEQLREWTNRADVHLVAQKEGSDAAAVVYDAIQAAKSRDADLLICDTAGRLHNKKNLMEELRKIDRIVDREYSDAYRETLLVLDATTGQNAMEQARAFKEIADITGIILTKLDGTAKGGIVVAIESELKIPVKYIGVGESIEDLQRFDPDAFVNALFTPLEESKEVDE